MLFNRVYKNCSCSNRILFLKMFQDDIRGDGRACLDYRTIELETDVIVSCNGSSMVKLVYLLLFLCVVNV